MDSSSPRYWRGKTSRGGGNVRGKCLQRRSGEASSKLRSIIAESGEHVHNVSLLLDAVTGYEHNGRTMVLGRAGGKGKLNHQKTNERELGEAQRGDELRIASCMGTDMVALSKAVDEKESPPGLQMPAQADGSSRQH